MTLIPDLRGRLAESTLEGHPWKATLSVLMSGHEDRAFSLYAGAFCVGNAYFHSSCRATEERFVWEMPIYKPHVESQRSVLRGKFLFTNLRSSHGGAFRVGNSYLQTQLERFVWEISIYKLNWSVSCGKFLFTNSTSVFSLFTNYLQTYLQTSFLREKAIFRHGHIKIQSLIGGFLTMDRSPGKCFFP